MLAKVVQWCVRVTFMVVENVQELFSQTLPVLGCARLAPADGMTRKPCGGEHHLPLNNQVYNTTLFSLNCTALFCHHMIITAHRDHYISI